MKTKLLFLTILTAIIMSSCNSQKDIPYMIGANQLPQEVLQSAARASDPIVMPGDMLQINVISRNTEAVKPFNKSDYISSIGGSVNNNCIDNLESISVIDGYLVGGCSIKKEEFSKLQTSVNLPSLGKIINRE